MSFSMPQIPGFGQGKKQQVSEDERLEEIQGLYRMFGLAEDAGYEEINEAYARLCDKYADQKKRLIKLAVGKDRILEHLLKQRMTGALKGPQIKERKLKKQPLIKVPRFLKNSLYRPTKKQLRNNGLFLTFCAVQPVLLGRQASFSMFLGLAYGFFALYGNVPTKKSQSGFNRPYKKKPLIITALVILGTAVFPGGLLFRLIYPFVGSAMPAEYLVAIVSSFCFFVASSFFQVKD